MKSSLGGWSDNNDDYGNRKPVPMLYINHNDVKQIIMIDVALEKTCLTMYSHSTTTNMHN